MIEYRILSKCIAYGVPVKFTPVTHGVNEGNIVVTVFCESFSNYNGISNQLQIEGVI